MRVKLMDEKTVSLPVAEKIEWMKPELRRIALNEAETGILFGPEILILLS